MEVTDLQGRGRTQDVNAGSLAPETVVFCGLCSVGPQAEEGEESSRG